MKAVIPAAGFGTRFLPATKAQPKEMLPVYDKPTIQYVIEEAVASGIDDILIVAGGGAGAYRYSGGAWSGASGGGFIGGYRSDSSMAGMQDGGYSFGQASDTYETFSTSSNHSGGGGGFYGGHSRWDGYAGGGSGYIGNELLIDGVMYCYDCSENANPGVVTISTTGDNKDSINISSIFFISNGSFSLGVMVKLLICWKIISGFVPSKTISLFLS